MPSALGSLRVLDLSRVLAGPYCTMLLGDYGAEVLKVEEPGAGDGTRGWGPPWVGDQSAYFLAANRNKRSLAVNLKHPDGLALVQRLAAVSDVLIENFKPGTMARLGLDYATLAAANPGLVYCSLTGYGQTGPYRDRPGYDFVIQAQGGVMSITGPAAQPPGPAGSQGEPGEPGEPGAGEPYKVGVAIADITTGLFAAVAILAALHERTTSGLGQQLDVALLDSQVAWLANVAQNYLATGAVPGRYGNAHPSIVPYETFPTADQPLALAVGTDEQFRKLCVLLGRPELAADPRFAANAGRVEHRAALLPQLQARFRTQGAAHWIDALLGVGIPAGPINNVAQALEDPQVQARDMVQTVEHATAGPVKLLGPVAKLSRTPAAIHRAPPPLGYDTDAVLGEVLGLDEQEIAALRERGAIA